MLKQDAALVDALAVKPKRSHKKKIKPPELETIIIARVVHDGVAHTIEVPKPPERTRERPAPRYYEQEIKNPEGEVIGVKEFQPTYTNRRQRRAVAALVKSMGKSKK